LRDLSGTAIIAVMVTDKDSRDLLRSIDTARLALHDDFRPDAVEKQRRRAAMTARERVAYLSDPGSFTEIGGLVRDASLSRPAPADGAITGTGRIDGRWAVIVSQDFTVYGGSSGKLGSAKIRRAGLQALKQGLPLVMLLDGGGHRIQDGQDSRHFAHAGDHFHNLARMSGWVPMVAAMLGAGFAGPTNYAGLADFVVMVRGQSTMGLAGPALVKAGTGEDATTETLGGAAMQVDRHGLADLGVESEQAALDAVRRFLSYLPSNARQDLPRLACADPPDRRDDILLDLVPANTRKAYDVRRVIATVADRDSVFEIKPTYAGNLVTSFARLAGRPVGFVANQPLRLGGMLDSPACEKGAHFIALCDAFGVPLIHLVDVPGFSIGSPAERTVLGRRSAKLIYELGHATVPRITVVLRKGYGLGYYAMSGGRSFDADACLGWPTAEICAMSIEGSVDVAFRKEYQDAPDPMARRQELIDGMRANVTSQRAAEGFGVDDIIDPRDTRRILIDVLDRVPARRDNAMPPKYRSIVPI
jgi:propionyl-CoA carboxylase beta chain